MLNLVSALEIFFEKLLVFIAYIQHLVVILVFGYNNTTPSDELYNSFKQTFYNPLLFILFVDQHM